GQKPTFTALSYTWGEPVMDGTLVLDGKILKITKNLETALNAIWRGGWSAKKWWIDQICINQSDIDERNSQVNLMREIYKKSEEVVV
ncbi:heterokaryon incompatibility, partial [Bisporella sp. PMI_857]